MPIKAEVEIARAEVNDDYGVTLWQRGSAMEYSTSDARALAAEMVAAADESDRVAAEDAGLTIEQLRERLSARVSDGVL